MLPPWATAVLSVGAFVSFALLLALIRMRSEGKLTVETREIAAAVVAVGIGLFLFGEFDEIAYGDFRLVRKISAEANIPVGDRIANKATTLEYEPISQQARKGSTDAIEEYLQGGVEALSFDLGKKNYYVSDVVRQYIERLTEGPYLKYVVFYEPGGQMKALVDARAIAAQFRMRDTKLTPRSLTNWITKPDLVRLKGLPGYVEPVDVKSTTREALAKMLQFDADFVPVVDEHGRFIGVSKGSQLIGRLVSALAAAEGR